MEAEFEKPDLFGSKGEQRKGRIWIAVGLLMLVLGLSLYGVRGEGRYVRQIELEKEAVGKWAEQFKNKGEDYIDVKMRIKEERRPIVKVEPTELRILYRPAATAEMKYEEMAEEETVSINKELLFSIHAELDDIGMYR